MKLLELLPGRSSGKAILLCGVPLLLSSTMLSLQPVNAHSQVYVRTQQWHSLTRPGLTHHIPVTSALSGENKTTLEQNNSQFLLMWNTQKHLQHHSVLLWTWMEARRSQLTKSCCLTWRLTESHCRMVPSQLQENVCLGMKVLLVLDPNIAFFGW